MQKATNNLTRKNQVLEYLVENGSGTTQEIAKYYDPDGDQGKFNSPIKILRDLGKIHREGKRLTTNGYPADVYYISK